MIYDDLILVFYDAIFNFVIILQAKSSSLDTYDEIDISFCDESKKLYEQMGTDDHFSSSVTSSTCWCGALELENEPCLLEMSSSSNLNAALELESF
jgi:hypothetical protein